MPLRDPTTGRYYALPEPMPRPLPVTRYRVVVFGRPRGPWRECYDDAVKDAVDQDLAAWDASRREWFIAVPTDIETRCIGR